MNFTQNNYLIILIFSALLLFYITLILLVDFFIALTNYIILKIQVETCTGLAFLCSYGIIIEAHVNQSLY